MNERTKDRLAERWRTLIQTAYALVRRGFSYSEIMRTSEFEVRQIVQCYEEESKAENEARQKAEQQIEAKMSAAKSKSRRR